MTNGEVECTDGELERFLERVLTLQRYQTVDDENATTDVGIVSLCLPSEATAICVYNTTIELVLHCVWFTENRRTEITRVVLAFILCNKRSSILRERY